MAHIKHQKRPQSSSETTLSEIFNDLYSQLRQFWVNFPEMTSDFSPRDILKHLGLYTWDEKLSKSPVLKTLIFSEAKRLQKEDKDIIWVLISDFEMILSLALNDFHFEVGCWICLFITKYFLKSGMKEYVGQYLLKYQLIYLRLCEQNKDYERKIPLDQFVEGFGDFQELYFQAIENLTDYSLEFKSPIERNKKTGQRMKQEVLNVWQNIWLRMLLLRSICSPFETNQLLKSQNGEELDNKLIECMGKLTTKEDQPVKVSFKAPKQIDQIFDNEVSFVNQCFVDLNFSQRKQMLECLNTYQLLSKQNPFLQRSDQDYSKRGQKQLIEDVRKLNKYLNLSINLDHDQDYDNYKSFSIGEYVMRTIQFERKHREKVNKLVIMVMGQKAGMKNFADFAYLFEQISYIAGLYNLKHMECSLLLFAIRFMVCPKINNIKVLIKKLKRKLIGITKAEYAMYETIKSAIFSELQILPQENQRYFLESYCDIFNDEEFHFETHIKSKSLDSEIQQLRIKLSVLLICWKQSFDTLSYFIEKNPKELSLAKIIGSYCLGDSQHIIYYKQKQQPNLYFQHVSKPTNKQTFKDDIGQHQILQSNLIRPYFPFDQQQAMTQFNRKKTKAEFLFEDYSALTGDLYVENKEEQMTSDQREYVILSPKEKVYEKLNQQYEIWEVVPSPQQDSDHSKLFLSEGISFEQVEQQKFQNQLLQSKYKKIFLIVNPHTSIQKVLPYFHHDSIIRIFIAEEVIIEQDILMNKKIVRYAESFFPTVMKERELFYDQNIIFGEFNYSIVSGNQRKLFTFRNNMFWMLHPQNKDKARQEFINFIQLFQKEFPLKNSFQSFQQAISSSSFRKEMKVVIWYMKQTPFYEVLNKALRILTHPTQIGYFRYPFAILFRSIQQLYYKQRDQSFRKSKFRCFRGCRLNLKEQQWIRSNKGAFIQLEGFLSTSMEKQIAKRFSNGTLLVIDVDPLKQTSFNRFKNGFAYISELSQQFHQQEVLFNPLNYFKIIGYYEDVDGFDEIHLEYCCSESLPVEIKKLEDAYWLQLLDYKDQGSLFSLGGDHVNFKNWLYGKMQTDIQYNNQDFRLNYKNRYFFPFLMHLYHAFNAQDQGFHAKYELLLSQIHRKNVSSLDQHAKQKIKYDFIKEFMVKVIRRPECLQLFIFNNPLSQQDNEVILKSIRILKAVFEQAIASHLCFSSTLLPVLDFIKYCQNLQSTKNLLEQPAQTSMKCTELGNSAAMFSSMTQYVADHFQNQFQMADLHQPISHNLAQLRQLRRNKLYKQIIIKISLITGQLSSEEHHYSEQFLEQLIKIRQEVIFYDFDSEFYLLQCFIRVGQALKRINIVMEYGTMLLKLLLKYQKHQDYFSNLSLIAQWLTSNNYLDSAASLLSQFAIVPNFKVDHNFGVIAGALESILSLKLSCNYNQKEVYRKRQEEYFEAILEALPNQKWSLKNFISFLKHSKLMLSIINKYLELKDIEKVIVMVEYLEATGFIQSQLFDIRFCLCSARIFLNIGAFSVQKGTLEQVLINTNKGLQILRKWKSKNNEENPGNNKYIKQYEKNFYLQQVLKQYVRNSQKDKLTKQSLQSILTKLKIIHELNSESSSKKIVSLISQVKQEIYRKQLEEKVQAQLSIDDSKYKQEKTENQ